MRAGIRTTHEEHEPKVRAVREVRIGRWPSASQQLCERACYCAKKGMKVKEERAGFDEMNRSSHSSSTRGEESSRDFGRAADAKRSTIIRERSMSRGGQVVRGERK